MVTPKVSVRFVTHERVQETTYAIFAGGIQRASAIGCLHVRNAIEAEHGKVEFGGAIKIDDGNREPIDCADRENRCRRPAELSDRYEEDLWGCLDALLRAVQEETDSGQSPPVKPSISIANPPMGEPAD